MNPNSNSNTTKSRRTAMKNALTSGIAIILSLASVTGCDAFKGPVATNIDTKIKELTSWMPKAIAQDPVGFMTHAITASDGIVLEMKAAQIGIAQQRAITDRRIASNTAELNAVKELFAEFRSAYQEASTVQTWPKTVQGVSYTEQSLRNQVTALAKRFEVCQGESKRLPEFQTRLSSYATQLEQRLIEAQAAKSEFARQLEVVRMNKAVTDLAALESQVQALVDTASFLENSSGVPTVGQLIENRNANLTDSDFTQLLTMPLE